MHLRWTTDIATTYTGFQIEVSMYGDSSRSNLRNALGNGNSTENKPTKSGANSLGTSDDGFTGSGSEPLSTLKPSTS